MYFWVVVLIVVALFALAIVADERGYWRLSFAMFCASLVVLVTAILAASSLE